ncbi:hypothetical protein BH11ARM2_BH11ARM2_06010 [soil metagenome]
METGMVHCKHCATPNCLDALYCKRCGTILSEEDVREAQAKLDLLLAEGRKAYEEGRTDEALAVAERILVSNPSMSSAIALMTEAHARRGEVAQALESSERLVELNPDSEIDKIRRDGLRAQLAESLRPAPAPDRRFAVIAGFSAVVLVACLGVLAARLSHPSEPNLVASNDTPTIQQPGLSVPTDTNSQNATTPTKPTNTTLGPGDVPPVREGDGETLDMGSSQRLPLAPYSGSNGQLPSPEGTRQMEVRPVEPTGPIGTGEGALPSAGGSKPPVPTTRPGIDPPPTTLSNNADNDPGEMSFVIHKGTGPSSKGTPTGSVSIEPSGNETQALLRAATQQFQLGNYSEAASAYEKALAGGADPLSTNQRLGMAYDNLGRKGEAGGAYRRAISAGEAMLAAGKGNPDRVRSAIETCKAALGGS